jgi:intracellular sulfur oxidation DsrE/DsrF family protein
LAASLSEKEIPMNRRSVFQVFAAAAATTPFVNRKAAAAGEKKAHRLVIHVDQNDVDVMKLALNNTRNANDLYKERGEELAVEIVCYSQGLHMLRDDTSPVKPEIRELRAKVPQVAFGACNNTKTAMEKREGKPVPIIAEATIVPAGIVRLVELQEEGYAYAKP